MRYPNIKEAVFVSRPNRFVAKVMIDGEIHTVHVKNTGRCKELLWDGRTVYLTRTNNDHRKTEYDLVSVLKDREGLSPLIINIDSTPPNDAVAEWLEGSGLFSENCRIKRAAGGSSVFPGAAMQLHHRITTGENNEQDRNEDSARGDGRR